jgi:hypothetical protein
MSCLLGSLLKSAYPGILPAVIKASLYGHTNAKPLSNAAQPASLGYASHSTDNLESTPDEPHQ